MTNESLIKTKKSYYFLIPAVALLLWFIYWLGNQIMTVFDTLPWSIMHTTCLWLGCYITVTFLWKKFPWEHNPVKHLLSEVGLIAVYTNSYVYAMWKLFPLIAGKDYQYDVFDAFMNTNLITFLITSIHEAVFFYRQWMANFSKSAKLEKENIQSKFEALKTQINPHFLFNSLNNLTALVDNNPQAVDYIQNLSQFLRYVLKNSDRELVPLAEELEMLNQYIALQKTRLENNALFTIDIHESCLSKGIPPLALQMLVENCLKHNVASRSHPLKIEVTAYDGWVSVQNNLQPKHGEASTGYGLTNLTERYRFFTQTNLEITQSNHHFKVLLPLLDIDF